MSGAAWFALGLGVGIAGVALVYPSETSCCQRVAYGARDKIAGYFGGASSAVSGFLDATGITNALPGWLDAAGVPKDV